MPNIFISKALVLINNPENSGTSLSSIPEISSLSSLTGSGGMEYGDLAILLLQQKTILSLKVDQGV